MIQAAAWGLVGASSLVLGSILAFVVSIPTRIQGLILAFGAGILFGAVAYELVAKAVRDSATGVDVAAGFGLGAIVFFVGSVAIGRLSEPRDDDARLPSRRDPRAGGIAIVLGAVLDGIPESVVLGLSFVPGEGVEVAILVAIFLSNVPEAVAATEDLAEGGMARARIIGVWVLVALASAASAALGFALLDAAPASLVIATQSFAAGAILAMLAESAIPEAYEKGGRPVGLATALGFAVATWLSLGT